MSEDAHSSGERYELDGDVALKSYEEWKEEIDVAELRDNFFLYEMRIAPCNFFNGNIITHRAFLPREVKR